MGVREADVLRYYVVGLWCAWGPKIFGLFGRLGDSMLHSALSVSCQNVNWRESAPKLHETHAR